MIASPADPVAAATGPGLTAAVAEVNGASSGATAALNSIEDSSIDDHVNASVDRVSVSVLGVDTGTSTTAPRVAAARPAARDERTDTVIGDFSLFVVFAAGVHHECTFLAVRRYMAAGARAPDRPPSAGTPPAGTTVGAMSVARDVCRSR